MKENENLTEEFYQGLQVLLENTFPRKCSTCGKIFQNAREFLDQTSAVPDSSGLNQSVDENKRPILELFRNCSCGSTMLEFFQSRRDESETGKQRRRQFQKLLGMLMEKGLDMASARRELLRVMRGERSEILEKLGISLAGQ